MQSSFRLVSDMQMSSAHSMADQLNLHLSNCDVHSTNSTACSSPLISTLNDFNSDDDLSMGDHEINSNPNASSSSCNGAAIASMEEGQGESRCDQHVRTRSTARTHDDRERPCDMDMAPRRGGTHLAPLADCHALDIEQEQEYFQQILGSSSYGWTDEKHSSYLDSMEADFMKSVMFRGNVLEELKSSELADSASSQQANKSFKEFKVCQNGRWRPSIMCVQPSYVGPLTQLAVAVKNPWIKRFRPSAKHKVSPCVLQDPLLQAAMDSRRRWRGEHSSLGVFLNHT